MAHIDDLVKKVADPQLRAALADQVRTLTDRTEFGLTFQRHLPESVRLPEQRIRRGDLVELRDEAKGGPRFRVVAAKANEQAVTVVELDSAEEAVAEPTMKSRSDLVVVKLFGNPIYPGLRRVGEAGTASTAQPSHVVINGENFHALQALEYTHGARVDVIYIDPPYNTGNADWKYNDRYVEGQDAYRHSKWLSFMERRLKIAKMLLKETGVIVLAIGDDEQHRLRMLVDQVFGESNFISNIVWQGGRKNDSRFISNGADYMLVYAKSIPALVEAGVRWTEPRAGLEDIRTAANQAWAQSGGDQSEATRQMKAWIASLPQGHPAKENNRFYEFDSDGRVFRKKDISWPGGGGPRYDVLHPVTGMPVKVPSRGWIYSKPERMQQDIDAGLIVWGKDHNDYINRKTYLDEGDGVVPVSVFERKRTSGGKALEQILGDQRFPYPKDVEVMTRWLRVMTVKDAVVLDFFAGSGSTAEAVMRLNEEDGGTRQCILVTNNELSKAEDVKLRKEGHVPGDAEYEAMGVFHHVTKPRLTTVLTGIREDGSRYSDGINGQAAAFFDLTYEDENLVALGRRFEAVAPLLWLKAGATGSMIEKITEWGYDAPEDANYAVIFDTNSTSLALDAFHDDIKLVYVVTDSDADFRRTVSALPRRLQPTAQRLYSTYLRSFEINRAV